MYERRITAEKKLRRKITFLRRMLADKDLKSFWENTESGAEINWKMQFKLIEKLKQIVRGGWIVKDNGASCAVMGDFKCCGNEFQQRRDEPSCLSIQATTSERACSTTKLLFEFYDDNTKWNFNKSYLDLKRICWTRSEVNSYQLSRTLSEF